MRPLDVRCELRRKEILRLTKVLVRYYTAVGKLGGSQESPRQGMT